MFVIPTHIHKNKIHYHRAIGVCCPDEVSEKAGASIVNLPQSGSDADEAPVWSSDNDPERNADQIIEKPEERGA